MARRQARPVAALSEGFLREHQHRLDAIGEWTVEADPANLDIVWKTPAALVSDWVPFDLEFHTDDDTPSFDPDGRMFELWEVYKSRHPDLVPLLRQECERVFAADGSNDSPRRVTRGCVVVSRLAGDGTVGYSLDVQFGVPGDEHCYSIEYDPETGALSELQS